MDENQFHELCAACDGILLEHESSPERFAVAWLHVIREHPVFLSRYERLFSESIKSAFHWMEGGRFVVEVLRAFRQLLRAARHGLRKQADTMPSADIIFVSHHINASQKNADFYFGTLPKDLSRQCNRVVVAQIDQTPDSIPHFRILPGEEASLNYVVLPNTLTVGEEFAMLMAMLGVSRQIANKSEHEGFRANVRHAAAAEALSSASFQALRIARQIAKLVERLRPKILITTFEGHAWERATFHLVRQRHPAIKCVGYQHAALFRLQHSIRRKLGNSADPDAIWTSGSVAAEQFRREQRLAGVKIAEIGSVRVLEYSAPLKQSREAGNASFTCLVLPEGLRPECDFLFEFSLECAAAYPQAAFIWRLHPGISFESLSQANPRLRRLPANVRVSAAAMQEDIAQSDCALYRGSTAVLQAVSGGAVPVYVRREDEMSIDPLYGAEVGVGRISAPGQLLAAIDAVAAGKDLEYIRNYCQCIFTPLRSAAEIAEVMEAL